MDFQESNNSLFDDQDFSCQWFDSFVDSLSDWHQPSPIPPKSPLLFKPNNEEEHQGLEAYYRSEMEVLEKFPDVPGVDRR